MRQRLIVAAIGLPLTAVVIWFLDGWLFTLIMMAVAICCIYELCKYKFKWWLIPVSLLIASSFWLLGVFRHELHREYTLILFACTYGSDGGAMLMGKYLGKSHPFPRISPNKTEMGMLGGLAAPLIIALICDVVLQLCGYAAMTVEFAVVGLIIGFASEAGDLFFSSIKRKLGIKDYGSILPGHGGLLDRFDSMVFAVPAALIVVVIFLFGSKL